MATGLHYTWAGRLSSAIGLWRRTSAERLAGECLRQLVGVRLASSLGGDLGLSSSRAVVWAPQLGASSSVEKRLLPWGLVWWAAFEIGGSSTTSPPDGLCSQLRLRAGWRASCGDRLRRPDVGGGSPGVVGVLRVLSFGNGKRILIDPVA